MTRSHPKASRLIMAVLVVVPGLVLAAAPSSFADSIREQRERAQAEHARIQHELEVAIESFNDARYRLDLAKTRELEAERERRAADAAAAESMRRLGERAVAAYTDGGNQIGTLFDAASLADFSDRLQFMGAVAQSDADLAAEADAAGQRAQWAADRYAKAVEAREKELDSVRAGLDRVREMLARQAALLEELDRKYEDYLAAQEAAARAAEAALASGGGGNDVGGGGGFVPPPNGTKAQIAIAAARSVIGTQYVWGSADPGTGFDCSGLTSWAWAQAGVYLPHSSAAQYASLPRIPYSQAQPGDILFFFSPVSHVGLYIGGGQMIHARHPGPGGEVQQASVAGYATPVGAGRPG
jgi:cell wall-associated NlpC family hydrolase